MEQLHFSEYSWLKKPPVQEYALHQLHDLLAQPSVQSMLSNTPFLQKNQRKEIMNQNCIEVRSTKFKCREGNLASTPN